MANANIARTIIEQVVEDFYRAATTDVLIGHQFRKIQNLEGLTLVDPLTPPIEAFRHHLPRIVDFWDSQLNGAVIRFRPPMDVVGTHLSLQLRIGEINRWVKLFKETLDRFEKEKNEFNDWRRKVDIFAERLRVSLHRIP